MEYVGIHGEPRSVTTITPLSLKKGVRMRKVSRRSFVTYRDDSDNDATVEKSFVDYGISYNIAEKIPSGPRRDRYTPSTIETTMSQNEPSSSAAAAATTQTTELNDGKNIDAGRLVSFLSSLKVIDDGGETTNRTTTESTTTTIRGIVKHK